MTRPWQSDNGLTVDALALALLVGFRHWLARELDREERDLPFSNAWRRFDQPFCNPTAARRAAQYRGSVVVERTA